MTSSRTLQFPPRISLAHTPTPLQPLPHLQAALSLSCRIWVKRDDLTGSHLSGNKIRKLEFLAARARAEGADTLITCGGVQSNHCRATALLAAQLGMQCHLILRGEAPDQWDGNLLLDKMAGARISYYPSHSFEAEVAGYFQHWTQHYAAQGSKAFCIPTGGSNGIGIWGYLACAQELHQQCADIALLPEQVVCATGSGGTQAGLTLGLALTGLPSQVTGMAVCDNAAWFDQKVQADIQQWHEWYPDLAQQNLAQAGIGLDAVRANTIDNYIGPGYARAGQEVFETLKLLARTEGLVLDPVYTGKAFHGLLQEVRQGRWQQARDIIFVHTGGIFGLFPQRQQFRFEQQNQ